MPKTLMQFPCAHALAAGAVALALAVPAMAQLATDAMATKSVPVTTDSTVNLPNGVTFSGNAVLKSRLAKDPEFGKPSLVLHFDLSGVAGIGKKDKKKYFVSSNEEIVVPHGPSQTVQFGVAVYSDPGDALSVVRTGVVTFNLNVDTATGQITSSTATVGAQ